MRHCLTTHCDVMDSLTPLIISHASQLNYLPNDKFTPSDKITRDGWENGVSSKDYSWISSKSNTSTLYLQEASLTNSIPFKLIW